MIISGKHNYVNIGIPKTASVSMRKWLLRHCAGRDAGAHHGWDWPKYAHSDNPLVFAVVRNPYARCYSLWKWETHTALSGGIQIEPACPFDRFLEMLIAHNREPHIYMNQADYIEAGNITCLPRLENLRQELKQLPFGGDVINMFPHLNANSGINKPLKHYYTKQTEALVWEYCQKEFGMLGYERMVAL